MKLDYTDKSVEVNGDFQINDFTIEISPVIFDILINKLYTNKVLAVIREICCNAHDALIAVKSNRKYFVHFPNIMEQFFYVRDYGPGLSKEQIKSLYTRLGASDKRNSNEVIGGFGIGSKAPFAYTNSFSVESYQDGQKFTYTCFIGQNKIPQVAFVGESSTDEPDGLKVQVPVKHSDFREFENVGRSILQYFDDFESNINISPIDYEHKNDNWAYSHNVEAKIIMGHVPYNCPKYGLLSGVHITVPIGTFTIDAGRENIENNSENIHKLEQLHKETIAKIQDYVKTKIPSLYERWKLSSENGSLFGSAKIDWEKIDGLEQVVTSSRYYHGVYRDSPIINNDTDKGVESRVKRYIKENGFKSAAVFKFKDDKEKKKTLDFLGIDGLLDASTIKFEKTVSNRNTKKLDNLNLLDYNVNWQRDSNRHWIKPTTLDPNAQYVNIYRNYLQIGEKSIHPADFKNILNGLETCGLKRPVIYGFKKKNTDTLTQYLTDFIDNKIKKVKDNLLLLKDSHTHANSYYGGYKQFAESIKNIKCKPLEPFQIEWAKTLVRSKLYETEHINELIDCIHMLGYTYEFKNDNQILANEYNQLTSRYPLLTKFHGSELADYIEYIEWKLKKGK